MQSAFNTPGTFNIHIIRDKLPSTFEARVINNTIPLVIALSLPYTISYYGMQLCSMEKLSMFHFNHNRYKGYGSKAL